MSKNKRSLLPRGRTFRDKLRVVVWFAPETNRVEYISLRQAALRYGKTERIAQYKRELLKAGYCFITKQVMVNL